jgi:hypothetical protein
MFPDPRAWLKVMLAEVLAGVEAGEPGSRPRADVAAQVRHAPAAHSGGMASLPRIPRRTRTRRSPAAEVFRVACHRAASGPDPQPLRFVGLVLPAAPYAEWRAQRLERWPGDDLPVTRKGQGALVLAAVHPGDLDRLTDALEPALLFRPPVVELLAARRDPGAVLRRAAVEWLERYPGSGWLVGSVELRDRRSA